MELPDPLFEEFVSTVLEPSPLDSRFQTLIMNAWAWVQQMKKNSKHLECLSPALQSALSAIAHIVTYLYRVISAFYEGNIASSSFVQLEQDIEHFERFVSVVCGEGDAKLMLMGTSDRVLLVFPEGAPFFPGPTVNDLYCETKMNEKANRLLDQELKSKFQDALQLFASTSQDFWPDGRKETLNATLVNDRGCSLDRQEEFEARMQELDGVRLDLLKHPHNATCHDSRVKTSLEGRFTISAAILEIGKEKQELKVELEKCQLRSRFFHQIRSYYDLDSDADASTAAALAGG